MKYKTTDEWRNFSFAEAYIGDIQATNGFFHMELDNVTILPENSCNRDIRKMRTNGLVLKLEDFAITSLIEEGYKVFDANGNPMKEVEDVVIAEKDYFSVIKELVEGVIYSLEKEENTYVFSIDAVNERTYTLEVKASHDIEEWERFLNLTAE
ncbi:subtilin biosynthesis sensor protein SpaK [Roseburia sp. 499]|uniref:subtilin biosynthesis sensor protein SpaK n=1 Tax=Roseburia sp. 499 TaxID=1261634 RepID=UPI0009527E59|nr:subtilin biosynthesis sensor protein SpaK [Roseburia sp. 499]WVK70262.1 subtilin biosynthesis sensor protein SpaK [Roseburia sp. 499]